MSDAINVVLESDMPSDDMVGRYPHVWKGLTETPWAVTTAMRDVIVTIAARRLAGEKLSPAEISAAVDGRPAHELPYKVSYSARGTSAAGGRGRSRPVAGQIAVLPLYGVMAARLGLIGQMSGGSSVESFMASFNQAMNDDQVSSILIDIDSPGGSTDLVAELGQLIYDARGDKPIAAIANTDACSAAYWVLAQADESACTPSGKVGSVGVYGIHQDLSAALDKAGVKPTVIQAGRYKTELHPFGPLSPEALEYHQGVVDAHYEMFVDAVARGTGVAASTVKSDFGEGRVLMAKPALKVGMIDQIATFDQMLNRLATGKVAAGKRSTAVAITRHLDLAADDMPPDDEPAGECATCAHDAHAGPCPVADCDCEDYSESDEPGAVAAIAEPSPTATDDTSPTAGATRLEQLLEGATLGALAAGTDLVLALDSHPTPEELKALREQLSAALPGRRVVVTNRGITLSAGDPATDLPASAGEPPQPNPSPDSLLHRRAVREALRPPAADAATEGGKQ